MRLRRRAAAAVVAVALAGLTACGGADQGADASVAEQAAPSDQPESEVPESDEPDAAESAGDMSPAEFGKRVSAAQAEAGTGHMEAAFDLQAGGQSVTMEMEGDFVSTDDPADVALEMSMDMAGQQMDMIVLDEAMYMSGAGMGTAAKPWIMLDLDDPNSPLGDVGQLYESSDPQAFTAYLDAATSVTEEGEESIDGVDTTHYIVTVDTKKMYDNPAFGGKQALRTLGLGKETTIETWVDGDFRPIQIELGLGQAGSLTANYSNWGDPLDIEAPPANKVMSFGSGMG